MGIRKDSGPLAIDLRNVAKIYKGRVHALRGVEMRVAPGEIFGLLGPNGAGKSTLVKIMMTVIRPTRAEGTLLGQPVGHKGTLRRVGYLPENHRFPRYLTGRQVVEFFAALAGVDRAARKRRAGELLELVGMSADANRKISTYSKGMAQRIGLAQALGNDPDLILLDEPTDGVDPIGRRDIRNVLMRLREQGKTVFINSHLLSELDMICDRAAILIAGTVVKQGTMDDLALNKARYEIELAENPAEAAAHARAAFPGAFTEQQAKAGPPPMPGAVPVASALVLRGKLENGTWIELDGTILRVGVIDPVQVQPLIDRLRQTGAVLRRVYPYRPSLEDLFIEAFQNSQSAPPPRP